MKDREFLGVFALALFGSRAFDHMLGQLPPNPIGTLIFGFVALVCLGIIPAIPEAKE